MIFQFFSMYFIFHVHINQYCKFAFTRSYLAVVAGLCTEADYIFIPEDPAKVDWPKRICEQLKQARLLFYEKQQKRHHLSSSNKLTLIFFG